MKTTIRRGMFETNSSSMHSIIVCKEPYNGYPNVEKIKEKKKRFTMDPDEMDTRYHIGFGYKDLEANGIHFCRGEARIYNKPFSKAQILILIYANYILVTKKYSKDQYKKEMRDFCDHIKELIESQTGLEVDIDIPPLASYKVSEEGDIGYYVNVNSEGLDELSELINHINENEMYLLHYLFDNRSIVVLGGDEYDSPYKVNYILSLVNYDHDTISNSWAVNNAKLREDDPTEYKYENWYNRHRYNEEY